jgi:uncharacterized protein YdeI (YjbR/CyaY-like superfamily)
MNPLWFATPSELRAWFKKNHQTAPELLLAFYKKGSGEASVTWPESVDEALCFGWIDGVRKSIDDRSYTIRFTPRRPRSIWSAVNIKRAPELIDAKRMQPAGLKAFASREAKRSVVYAYEQGKTAKFDPAQENQFRANKKAWAFFQAQPPWWQRRSIWRVISAKREDTKRSRLAALIEASEQGRQW